MYAWFIFVGNSAPAHPRKGHKTWPNRVGARMSARFFFVGKTAPVHRERDVRRNLTGSVSRICWLCPEGRETSHHCRDFGVSFFFSPFLFFTFTLYWSLWPRLRQTQNPNDQGRSPSWQGMRGGAQSGFELPAASLRSLALATRVAECPLRGKVLASTWNECMKWQLDSWL